MTSAEVELHGQLQPVGGLLSNDEFEGYWRMAKALAAGRMFKDVTQAEQAFSKMVVGHYLGLNPAQSMMGIQLVRGNVMFSYPTLGAFIRSRPGYNYKILKHTAEEAEIEFSHDGEVLGTASFSVEDARRAKIIKDGGGWETYPENMCVARALSKGLRFFMPEALGGIPVYVEGEIPPERELSEGEGSGQAVGLELPPQVEAVIDRAESLGHVGLADRATWETRVGRVDRSVEDVVDAATAELDAWEERRRRQQPEPTDADVVEELDPEGGLRPEPPGEEVLRERVEEGDVLIETAGLPEPVPPAEDFEWIPRNETTHLPLLLMAAFGISTSEARRALTQGVVRVGDEVVKKLDVEREVLADQRVSLGKRRAVIVRLTQPLPGPGEEEASTSVPEAPPARAEGVDVEKLRERLAILHARKRTVTGKEARNDAEVRLKEEELEDLDLQIAAVEGELSAAGEKAPGERQGSLLP